MKYQRENRFASFLFDLWCLIAIIIFYAGQNSMDRKLDKILQSIESQEQVKEETQINTPNCLEVLSVAQEIGKEEISENRAISLMIMLGIEHPHIVYAQMRLESGNFTSSLARDCNNFFGMKHPKVRTNVSLGANSRGFATYDNWAMSVLDYGLWQRRYASGLTEEEYYSMLSKHYAEDSEYCKKVSNIISNIDFNFTNYDNNRIYYCYYTDYNYNISSIL